MEWLNDDHGFPWNKWPLGLSLVAVILPLGLLAQPSFTDVTDSANVNHQFVVHEGMFGGGACVFDLNGDGFEDIYLTGGMNEDQLLRNNGDGTFTDVHAGSGLELANQFVTQGVVGADINRDGHIDLFVTTITSRDSLDNIPRARNLLFLGQGGGKFRDATEAYGLTPLYSFSTGANFGDFNADGWPDLYVGNYFIEYTGELSVISDATIVGANQTARGYLLRNDEGEVLTNVYDDYGMDHRGFGFGGVFTDYDNDGDQDIIVHHDFGYKAVPSFLYENRYPRKGFRDVSEETEMDLKINAMGAAGGDFDEDGDLDYFISDIRFNEFMVNHKAGEYFEDQLKERGMAYVTISWGANWADFDHDGDVDLFVSNGDLNPNCQPMANFYFHNEGGQFEELGRATGLADPGIGRGSVVFDLENDGDLDLLVVCQKPVLEGYPVASTTRLLRNDNPQGNWLKVALQGQRAESHGLGSRVEVRAGGRRMIREIDGGGGSHLSQNSTIAHFGVGEATVVDSVIVTWTGGKEQILTDQSINQLLTIVEAEGPTPGQGSGWVIWLALGVVALSLIVVIVRQSTNSKIEST